MVMSMCGGRGIFPSDALIWVPHIGTKAEIDGLIVPSDKASTLLTDHQITGGQGVVSVFFSIRYVYRYKMIDIRYII